MWFGILRWHKVFCHLVLGLSLQKTYFPKLYTILHHMQWHPPWRSFLPAGRQRRACWESGDVFFWNQIVLLKTRCPKNPDPSKVPILRTWTPALQVQTLPCTEASGCCPCSTMISADVIERCLYDGSHPDDQLLAIQHPSYKWVLHTLTIFLAICECHPSLNLMKQQVLLVPATSVKKSNLIKKNFRNLSSLIFI